MATVLSSTTTKLMANRWKQLVTLAALAAANAVPLGAQKQAQEFTKQGLLITNFSPAKGTTMKVARRATDAVRSRIGKLVNKRDVDVIEGRDIALRLERSSFNPDTVETLDVIHSLARYLRADEYILAEVSSTPARTSIRGELVLFRDERLRQPLLEVTAPHLDSAASLFAKTIAAARVQLVHERRCENALREGSGSRAIAAAREGVKLYAPSVIARVCMLWAMRQINVAATEMLDVANEVLTVDARNPHALEAAAIALDSLRRRDAAADHWLRVAASDTANLELQLRVSYALLDGGNAKRAEAFIVALAKEHPEELRFTQQQWRAAYENKTWDRAIDAAETLLQRDSVALRDSVFFLRLGTAYRAAAKPFKAIEILARGVASFPKDARLYSLYTQSIKSEADTVIPRGLALFPKNSDLLALNAKELRARGRIEESLNATKEAVALDSTMKQGQLMVAQLEIELGRPDSAIVALHRALERGEDTTLVAQFALAKGNTMYKAANSTMSSTDFSLAMRMIAFSDSTASTQQSKFLVGAAALGVAQTTLTEASKLTDKAASCRLTKLGADLLPFARAGLTTTDETFAEAAKQSLGYLDQLDPYAQQQLKLLCTEVPRPPA